jgi:hypothetical protein
LLIGVPDAARADPRREGRLVMAVYQVG